MIEQRFKFTKLLGAMLVGVGFVGISYLVWVYAFWAKTLPSFPTNMVTEVFGARSVFASTSSFGDLLPEGDVLSAQTFKLPVVQKQEVKGETSQHANDVTISIPSLNITDAQVALDVNGQDEDIYDTVLKQSIAHLAHSAYPGELGNTFLFGHSMLPLLTTNNYESIFTSLPQMRSGDVVFVAYGEHVYEYEITHTGVVEPTDVFIMNQPKSKYMITLMTCIPPGFANQRYIAVGNLIRIEDR